MQDPYYQTLDTDCDSPQYNPIDWRTLAHMTPWLVNLFTWGIWCGFLLLPTVYGLHNTPHYPLENNLLFVLTGLVLAIAGSVALSVGHVGRCCLFAFPVFLLAVWF